MYMQLQHSGSCIHLFVLRGSSIVMHFSSGAAQRPPCTRQTLFVKGFASLSHQSRVVSLLRCLGSLTSGTLHVQEHHRVQVDSSRTVVPSGWRLLAIHLSSRSSVREPIRMLGLWGTNQYLNCASGGSHCLYELNKLCLRLSQHFVS